IRCAGRPIKARRRPRKNGSAGYLGADKTMPLAELRKNRASGLNGGRRTLIHRKNTPKLPNSVENVISAARSNSPSSIRNVLWAAGWLPVRHERRRKFYKIDG